MSIAARFGALKWVRKTSAKVDVLFSKRYLLVTNTCITVLLSGTGDALQQHYELLCKRQNEWDTNRSRMVCTTGLVIGPACHFWYQCLDRFLPGRTFRIVAKKVIVDQVIFSPLSISLFLVTMGMLEGKSIREVQHYLRDKGLTLLKAEWLIWPPAMMFNFYILPTRFRVLFDNTVSLGFDYYYSYVMFTKDKITDEVNIKSCSGAISDLSVNSKVTGKSTKNSETMDPCSALEETGCFSSKITEDNMRNIPV